MAYRWVDHTATGAAVLVIDGASDRRSAPPHDELALQVVALCPRAAPGFDGMEIEV